MANIHIQEAARNLQRAAQDLRDQKQQLLNDADQFQRDLDKQISDKQTLYTQAMHQATAPRDNDNKTEIVHDAELQAAKQMSRDIDDLKKQKAQRSSELQAAADNLEQQARQLDQEARQLQMRA